MGLWKQQSDGQQRLQKDMKLSAHQKQLVTQAGEGKNIFVTGYGVPVARAAFDSLPYSIHLHGSSAVLSMLLLASRPLRCVGGWGPIIHYPHRCRHHCYSYLRVGGWAGGGEQPTTGPLGLASLM